MSIKTIKLEKPLSQDEIKQLLNKVYSDEKLKDYKDIDFSFNNDCIKLEGDNSYKLQRAYDNAVIYLDYKVG